MERIPNCGNIGTFKELLSEIGYSWEYPLYDFIKHKDGYSLNKLYIEPNFVTYKCECWSLDPKVFKQFEEFYKLINA